MSYPDTKLRLLWSYSGMHSGIVYTLQNTHSYFHNRRKRTGHVDTTLNVKKNRTAKAKCKTQQEQAKQEKATHNH